MAALMATQPDSRSSACERNAELLTEILRRSEHLLRRQARRHAELAEDADDALQSACLLFIERYNGLGEPLAWLYTTVKREAWAMRRRTWRQRECSLVMDTAGGPVDPDEALPSELPGPAERTERDELVAEKLQAISRRKPDERRAPTLLAMGLSYVEICENTGWTHTKVNRCVSEGRSALRDSPT